MSTPDQPTPAPTPKTDLFIKNGSPYLFVYICELVDFARQLERELEVAVRERNDAIRRFEEAIANSDNDEDLFEDPFTGEPCSYERWVDQEVDRILEKDEP